MNRIVGFTVLLLILLLSGSINSMKAQIRTPLKFNSGEIVDQEGNVLTEEELMMLEDFGLDYNDFIYCRKVQRISTVLLGYVLPIAGAVSCIILDITKPEKDIVIAGSQYNRYSLAACAFAFSCTAGHYIINEVCMRKRINKNIANVDMNLSLTSIPNGLQLTLAF